MDAPRQRPARTSVLIATLLLLIVVLPGSVLAGRVTASKLVGGTSAPRPALAADAAVAPLGRPVPPPSGRGGYAFLGFQDDDSGDPVRWDPCRPIHYVVRPNGAPPGGAQAIADAVAEMTRRTGLVFVDDGSTTEAPRQNRPTVDVPRYGERWSPVLVAWTDPVEHPAIAGYAGLGGPDSVSSGRAGSRRYVTGVVMLNAKHLTEVVSWEDGHRRMHAVVLHEFGHLVGLDHVDDTAQLMFRRPTALPLSATLGDGDLRGLARLALGPCFRDF